LEALSAAMAFLSDNWKTADNRENAIAAALQSVEQHIWDEALKDGLRNWLETTADTLAVEHPLQEKT